MSFPAEHFPGTPTWVSAAILAACELADVNPAKWLQPLECMDFYESGHYPASHLCDADTTLPVGSMQLARGMYRSARDIGLVRSIRIADPAQTFLVAISYVQGVLPGYGGWGGIGTVDGKIGLLPRTDRGPGNVLRLWIKDPVGFDLEAARPLYIGY